MNPQTLVSHKQRVPILFLDLDGTVRKGFDELGRFVNKASDVELFPLMAERIASYRKNGWRVVGVTNQGGIATGNCSFDDVREAIVETQKQAKNGFDRIFMCQHHPEAHDPEMANCFCRKPKMGMLVMAQEDLSRMFPCEIYPPHLMLMVGDRPEDQKCAESAGISFKWAADWRNEPFTLSIGEEK
jgi:D-glycero-D-manno-heptose 1,7-bisphosphate phosphatase